MMLLPCVVQHCTECRDCKDQLVHISTGNIGHRMVGMDLTAHSSCIFINYFTTSTADSCVLWAQLLGVS